MGWACGLGEVWCPAKKQFPVSLPENDYQYLNHCKLSHTYVHAYILIQSEHPCHRVQADFYISFMSLRFKMSLSKAIWLTGLYKLQEIKQSTYINIFKSTGLDYRVELKVGTVIQS